MRTSPGWALRTGCPALAFAILDVHQARVVRVDRIRPSAISRTARGSSLCSITWTRSSILGDAARIGKRERLLQDDRTAVDALVDEMNRDSHDLDPVRESLLDRLDAREGRQQRRVDVDDAPAEAVDELWPNSSMKPARTTRSTPRSSSQSPSARSRAARSS